MCTVERTIFVFGCWSDNTVNIPGIEASPIAGASLPLTAVPRILFGLDVEVIDVINQVLQWVKEQAALEGGEKESEFYTQTGFSEWWPTFSTFCKVKKAIKSTFTLIISSFHFSFLSVNLMSWLYFIITMHWPDWNTVFNLKWYWMTPYC